jgi:hypothetical protein
MSHDDRLTPPLDRSAQEDLDHVFERVHDVLGDHGLHDLRPFARDLHAIALGRLRARQLHKIVSHDHLHQHVAPGWTDGDRPGFIITHAHLHSHADIEHGHYHVTHDHAHVGRPVQS